MAHDTLNRPTHQPYIILHKVKTLPINSIETKLHVPRATRIYLYIYCHTSEKKLTAGQGSSIPTIPQFFSLYFIKDEHLVHLHLHPFAFTKSGIFGYILYNRKIL